MYKVNDLLNRYQEINNTIHKNILNTLRSVVDETVRLYNDYATNLPDIIAPPQILTQIPKIVENDKAKVKEFAQFMDEFPGFEIPLDFGKKQDGAYVQFFEGFKEIAQKFKEVKE